MKSWARYLLPANLRKKLQTGEGYTLIEVMIALAVTGALFASVVVLLGGKQIDAQFEQAVKSYEVQIQNIISETANGYYGSNFSCTATVSGKPTASGSAALGENRGCVFAGKFLIPEAPMVGETTVMTVLGRQYEVGSDSKLASSIEDSQPTPAPESYDQSFTNIFGLKILKMVDSGGGQLSSFGYFLPSSGSSTDPGYGGSSVGVLLYGVDGSVGSGRAGVASRINQTPTEARPLPDGLEICAEFDEKHRAQIRIGAENTQTSIVTTKGPDFTGACI